MSKPFVIPEAIVRKAERAGARQAAEWLRNASPEQLERSEITDLFSLLLREGPTHVLLASWPRSDARDEVVDELLTASDFPSDDFRTAWFPAAASWIDVREQDPSRIDDYAHLGAMNWEHADAIARAVEGMPFQYEPNPHCWTDTGMRDKHFVPGDFVPGGHNWPPHYDLMDVVNNGVAGVVALDARIPEVLKLASERGCEARVLGPLESTPARIISWDGQVGSLTYTVLETRGGIWLLSECNC